MSSHHSAEAERAMRRLSNWGDVFARWQAANPDEAIADSVAARLLLRAEMHALVALLTEKGIIGPGAFDEHLAAETNRLCSRLEQRFPGFTATAEGVAEDLRAVDTIDQWVQP